MRAIVLNKRTARLISLITVLFAGFLFVTGVAAQTAKTRHEPACPPATRPAPPAAPRGAGVGAATGTGIGAANGTGIGAANGTGIGGGRSGLGRVQMVPMLRVSHQAETSVGTGIGAATGNGVGNAAAETPAETTPPAPETDTKTYIKELNGKCYYVTNDGEKAYVARKKCELY